MLIGTLAIYFSFITATIVLLLFTRYNIKIIKGVDNEDDHKQIAILNNEFRKISKKTRLIFIKKENIINYESINKCES